MKLTSYCGYQQHDNTRYRENFSKGESSTHKQHYDGTIVYFRVMAFQMLSSGTLSASLSPFHHPDLCWYQETTHSSHVIGAIRVDRNEHGRSTYCFLVWLT